MIDTRRIPTSALTTDGDEDRPRKRQRTSRVDTELEGQIEGKEQSPFQLESVPSPSCHRDVFVCTQPRSTAQALKEREPLVPLWQSSREPLDVVLSLSTFSDDHIDADRNSFWRLSLCSACGLGAAAPSHNLVHTRCSVRAIDDQDKDALAAKVMTRPIFYPHDLPRFLGADFIDSILIPISLHSSPAASFLDQDTLKTLLALSCSLFSPTAFLEQFSQPEHSVFWTDEDAKDPARLAIWQKMQALHIFVACGGADHDCKYPNSPVVDWSGGSMRTQDQSLKPVIDYFVDQKEEKHHLRRAACITPDCFATLKVHAHSKKPSSTAMTHWRKEGKDRSKHRLKFNGDDIEFWQLPSKALRATLMVLGSRELKERDGRMWAVVGLESWGRGT